MGFCLGVLGWTPQGFWKATVWEIEYAMEMYAISKGLKKTQGHLPSEEERAALRARLERERKQNG